MRPDHRSRSGNAACILGWSGSWSRPPQLCTARVRVVAQLTRAAWPTFCALDARRCACRMRSRRSQLRKGGPPLDTQRVRRAEGEAVRDHNPLSGTAERHAQLPPWTVIATAILRTSTVRRNCSMAPAVRGGRAWSGLWSGRPRLDRGFRALIATVVGVWWLRLAGATAGPSGRRHLTYRSVRPASGSWRGGLRPARDGRSHPHGRANPQMTSVGSRGQPPLLDGA